MTEKELKELEHQFVVLKIKVSEGEKEWRGYLKDCEEGMFSLCIADMASKPEARHAIGSVQDVIEARVVSKEEACWPSLRGES